MAAPDMEVIKEIPGYKVILKAIVKSQIQQLVEHLASHTDEETVVLTASVSDGTLSHLGSESGKSFLEDHEDMKSQFLGFCLKRHHMKAQEEALKKLEAQTSNSGFVPNLSPSGQLTTPRHRNQRHEPYRRGRGRVGGSVSRSSSLTSIDQPLATSATDVSGMKFEPANENSSDITGESGGESNFLDSNQSSESAADLDPGSQTENSYLGREGNSEQLEEQNSSALCENVTIKQEVCVDTESELQITGVEPGHSMPQDSWGANVSDISMDTSYDQSGATGSSFDVQAGQQGYRQLYDELFQLNASRPGASVDDSMFEEKVVSMKCPQTGHATDVKKYACLKCDYTSFVRSNLKRHVKSKHILH